VRAKARARAKVEVEDKVEVLARPPWRRPLTVAPCSRPRMVSTSSSVQTQHKNNLNLTQGKG
jgi:hypothetical protein